MEAIPRYRLLLTLAVYAGLAAVAIAQGPPRGPGGPGGRGGPGGGMGGLLRIPEVREELELLDDQQEQLRELEESMRSRMRERFEEMRSQRGEGGDRRRGFEGMREVFEEMRSEAESQVGEILTTQQFDRLKQINAQQQLQRGGGRALMGGPMAEALDLSDEQQEQLRERSQEIQAELRDKMREAQAEAREKLLEILTSEQRAKLDEMMGDPFDLPTPDRGFGGRHARDPRQPFAEPRAMFTRAAPRHWSVLA